MRYIKPPKNLTMTTQLIECPIYLWDKQMLLISHTDGNIDELIFEFHQYEYFIDVEVFRSALITELLDL